ncbi:MAG TPA: hypothetical protein VLC50_07005 [Actinomycetes bacterium]|nr:hypothetical protein [Actinomycetes bacterium]
MTDARDAVDQPGPEPRPRSHRLVPLAAALAVLVVVGLVAVVAAARPDGPPPLGLTSVAADGAEPGIASYGGSGGYVLEAVLPAGPATAPVHRLPRDADAAAVSRLATALGLPGSPVDTGSRWEISAGARVLRVASTAGAQWTYARDVDRACLPMPGAGPDEPVSCAAVAEPATPPGAPTRPSAAAVSETRAVALAEPVLRAAGLDPAHAVVTGLGPQALVRVDPMVAGLPTAGWSTAVTVDVDGVVTVSGWLSTTTRTGPDYPVVSARAAFDRLAASPVPALGMACPEPAVGQSPLCGGPVTVTGATFGLSLEQTTDGPLLVPAWLFEVADSPDPVPVVAVDPAFWGSPADPVPPSGDPDGSGGSGSSGGSVGGGAGVEPVPPSGVEPVPPSGPSGPPISEPGPAVTPPTAAASVASATVGADERTVELAFWGAPDVDGPCGAAYAVSVAQAPDAVVVAVNERPRPISESATCPAIAAERHLTVALDAPLAQRPIIDAATGTPVPLHR